MKKCFCVVIALVLLFAFCSTSLAATCGSCGSSNLSYTRTPCDTCYAGNITYIQVHPKTGIHAGHTLMYEVACIVFDYECRECGHSWTQHDVVRTGTYFCDQCDA